MARRSGGPAASSSLCADSWVQPAHAVAAIDGSKFKAVNARDKNYTKAYQSSGGWNRSRPGIER